MSFLGHTDLCGLHTHTLPTTVGAQLDLPSPSLLPHPGPGHSHHRQYCSCILKPGLSGLPRKHTPSFSISKPEGKNNNPEWDSAFMNCNPEEESQKVVICSVGGKTCFFRSSHQAWFFLKHMVYKLESGGSVIVLAQSTGISLLSSNSKERPLVFLMGKGISHWTACGGEVIQLTQERDLAEGILNWSHRSPNLVIWKTVVWPPSRVNHP